MNAFKNYSLIKKNRTRKYSMTLSRIHQVFIAGSIALGIAACNPTGQKGTISGELKGAEGKTLYLHRLVNNRMVPTDSTVIGADGTFVLSPSQPLSMNFYRVVLSQKDAIYVIMDSTESLELKGDIADLVGTAKVSGSANSEALRELELELHPYTKAYQEVVTKLSNPAMSPEEKATHREALNNSRAKQSEIIKKWLDNNAGTLGALIAVKQLDPRIDEAYYTKVFTALEPAYGDLPIYKAIRQESEMLINPKGGMKQATNPESELGIGKQAPEIALSDPKGKVRKLSDLKGKTVLVDFWASWCGPCRRENPNVVAAYQKYHKDGFEVFSVSLDKDKQSWIEAITKDKLTWDNHVSDLKWWDSEAAKTYGVSGIPKAFLLDKDGKIIGSDLRGPALEAQLQKIYGH